MLQHYPKHKFQKSEPPSMSWIDTFMKRNSFITMKENPLEKERSENGSVGNVKFWFSKIESELNMKDYHPSMIGNLDETMLSSKGRSLVVVKKGTRFATSQDISNCEHITILKLIINNGYGVAPLFIFKLKNIPTILDSYLEGGRLMVAGQKEGWIDAELFEQYMGVIVEFLKKHRQDLKLPPMPHFYYSVIVIHLEKTLIY